MITKEEVKTAKDQWEQAKLSHSLAIAAWGLLRKHKDSIIQSLLLTGSTQGACFEAYEQYDEDKRKTTEELNSFMNRAEQLYSELDAKFKLQNV
ncbi:hypothetical protein HBO12_00805 [Pseudomonas sp. WS 5059]|uniref:hypothetical protein n=1 Tax=Pseudomonas sp. WS 5059 TaxID=2717491 RepID=UPI001476099C|nr:hypothetical protein [Pseudomonas sp. WS 5059]NMY01475.1 hypothetical protein [Pseudomonas sp. WS 5059]